MVSFRILPASNLSEEYLHSIVISLLRGLAGFEVAAAHLRARLYPGYSLITDPGVPFQMLTFFTGFAHQAVVVFFLLSGWLVGGSLLNKKGQDGAIKNYAIDRITRLWIVLIPTFLVILVFGILTGKVDQSTASFAVGDEFSLTALLENLFGLQQLAVPVFRGDFPLWSLSNETWYYALFPLLVVASDTRSVPIVTFAVVAGAILSYSLGSALSLYFAIWLLGAVASRIKVETSAAIRWTLLLTFSLVAIFYRVKGRNDDLNNASFLQDCIFSVSFLLFLCSVQTKISARSLLRGKLQAAAKLFANFSFTLYVIHIPLIGMVVYLNPYLSANRLLPNNPIHLGIYVTILGSIVAMAYLFHLPFEANTHRLRNCLKNIVSGKQQPA
jgi:peptidoglycan/LPS O-acetylase OafA/YrhL